MSQLINRPDVSSRSCESQAQSSSRRFTGKPEQYITTKIHAVKDDGSVRFGSARSSPDRAVWVRALTGNTPPRGGGRGEVKILLVTSCYGNRDKLLPDGSVGEYTNFTHHTLLISPKKLAIGYLSSCVNDRNN